MCTRNLEEPREQARLSQAGHVGLQVGGVAVVGTSVSHRYPGPLGEVSVLEDATFEVAAGGYAALVGASGAGKTTLLALVGGLERVQSGSLSVGGHEVGALEGDALAAYRRMTVGFIFQNFGLLEALTAQENVEMAAVLAGERAAARRLELLVAEGLHTTAVTDPASARR